MTRTSDLRGFFNPENSTFKPHKKKRRKARRRISQAEQNELRLVRQAQKHQ